MPNSGISLVNEPQQKFEMVASCFVDPPPLQDSGRKEREIFFFGNQSNTIMNLCCWSFFPHMGVADHEDLSGNKREEQGRRRRRNKGNKEEEEEAGKRGRER